METVPRKPKKSSEEQWVSADRARRHVNNLMSADKSGARIGQQEISRLSGVPRWQIRRLEGKSAPRSEKIRADLEAKVLGVTKDHRSGYTVVEAGPVDQMYQEIRDFGITRGQIRSVLGRSFHMRKGLESRRSATAWDLSWLHWSLWLNSGEFRMRCRCEVPDDVMAEMERRGDEGR